ncbi:MAG TPA: glycoside hydrolase family 15 protein [Sandaracinaceae bacterium LLY-WYZ-13_1]|nr:glycoside hydrolase family 15 protein [Sandaracinaceae bacterium LLY-WYZ-13_1]
MDLYSAAKRLNRPFVFDDGTSGHELPIGARGLIGDGSSCALVRADGAIDWACMPRFDSPSVFGAILDPDRGGLTAITPTARPFESLQRYDPGTNVLETLFRIPGQGVVRMTDYMPWTDDPRATIHEIHRRVQCVEGEVTLVAVFDPRFDYGRAETRLSVDGEGVLASGGPDTMAAVLEGAAWKAGGPGGVEARFSMHAGEGRWMVLSWDAPQPEPIRAYRPYEHLRMTRHRWREWANQLTYDGPWRHHVVRSALVLKLMIHARTGAMVAAPTASLPEWIGNQRNWDYRYAWTRDAAMAIRAANLIGYGTEARDFFHFVRETLEDRDHVLHVMYAVDGAEVPAEQVLDHLRGFRDSSPVRIGNGARDQVQLDISGALVDAAWLYERFGGSITLRTWRGLREVVEAVRGHWTEPDHGIWEPRGEMRHNLHSKLMCWLALDRGARMCQLFGDDALSQAWKRASLDVHDDILRQGLDAGGRHFVSAYGLERADASLLLFPIHGFLEPTHPVVSETIDWVRRELATGPFLHRYRMDDGVGGPEGAFVLCGFWLAEALAMAGEVDEAQEIFVAHAEASNHLGLLAEEIDPASRALLGNFPQAFSHLGLINAAARIDLALRLRDEGSRKVPHLMEAHHTVKPPPG